MSEPFVMTALIATATASVDLDLAREWQRAAIEWERAARICAIELEATRGELSAEIDLYRAQLSACKSAADLQIPHDTSRGALAGGLIGAGAATGVSMMWACSDAGCRITGAGAAVTLIALGAIWLFF